MANKQEQKQILNISNLSKKFGNFEVLKNINLVINEFERVAIIGGNGVGKTTLLNIMSGNDKSFSGKVERNFKMSEASLQFQSFDYPDTISIFDLLKMFWIKRENSNKEDIKLLLEKFSLWEKRNDNISSLSSGQAQKFNLLLALATNPKIIFFDEILSGLDQVSIQETIDLLKELVFGKMTSITATHNPKEIFELCDRVVVIENGLIACDDEVKKFKTESELSKHMSKYINQDEEYSIEQVIFKQNELTFEESDLIHLRNIKKNYGINEILKGTDGNGISLDINEGERIAIIGKNGSGKSTLSEIISRTTKHSSGFVFWNEKKLSGKVKKWNNNQEKIKELIGIKDVLTKEQNKELKKCQKINIKLFDKIGDFIGVQFQKQDFPDYFTLNDVFKYSLMSNGIKDISQDKIDEALSVFSLRSLKDRKCNELSAGQKQKLNILIALSKSPKILILDELTTGLDVVSQKRAWKIINEYLLINKSSLIIITHSQDDIKNLSDKVLLIENGDLSKEFSSSKFKSNKDIQDILN